MRSDFIGALLLGAAITAITATTAFAAGGAAAASEASAAPPRTRLAPLKTPPLDINSASAAQLKQLPGIGDEQAARIVAGRPYLSKADLVTGGAIPAGTYLAIKRRIVALQKQPLQVRR